MKASKECLNCPWKRDVGNKYVCMFAKCAKDKLRSDSNGKT